MPDSSRSVLPALPHKPRASGAVLALAALTALGAGLAHAGDGRERAAKAGSAREEALLELGRRLFFDPKVSRTASRSCAACHDPLHAFSDPRVVSDDELGLTRRHSQTLVDSVRNPSAHWDGEFASVEHLVLARVGALPGGSHGFASELTSASERRERARQGRHAASTPQAPATSGAATPAPAAPSPTPGEAPAPAGEPASKDPAGGDAGAAPAPTGQAPAQEAPGEAFIPAPKDNPAYVGRFAQPQGTVGRNIRKPTDAQAPASPAAPAPAEPSDSEPAPADAASDGAATSDPAPEPTTPSASAPATAGGKPAEPPSDGSRAKRAEEEEAAPIIDVTRLPRVSEVLEQEGRYAEAFDAAFGTPVVSDGRIARAIAAYVRSLRSTPSAFDRFSAGDVEALSPLARQGLALFRGRAGCAQCHLLDGPEPALSDYGFHNTGIAWKSIPADSRLSPRGLEGTLDAGRQGVSSRPTERRAFKTPTLRDVAVRAPYMHDGSLPTLTDVVRHYATGASEDPRQDPRLKGFTATEQEVQAIVAFLQSLTGADRAGRADRAWALRSASTTLTFLDARGRALAGLRVHLVPVGDELPAPATGARAPALLTDERGQVTFTPPAASTHTQVVLPEDLGTLAPEWIPDSCRAATLRVPVLGRVRVVVTADDLRELPDTLAVDLPGARALPNQVVPRATLTRVGAVTGDAGLKTAMYAAWVRSDLPGVGLLRVPGDRPTKAPIVLHLDADATLTVDLR